MYQVNLFPYQNMGCGGSKAVATISTGSAVSVNTKHERKPTSSKGYRHDINVAEYSREHTDIAVFNDTDISTDPVDNAKPKLPRSGIRRIQNPNEKPIAPCIDNQSDLPPSPGRLNSISTVESESCYNTTPRKNSNCSSGKESISTETVDDSNVHTNGCDNPPNYNKEDLLVYNPLRLNLTESRASSVQAGSILTTTALNASILTSADTDDLHSEACFGPLVADCSEFDESTFRTLSITPSVDKSVEATPAVLQEMICGPIMEEFEGGFTPRSIITNGEIDTRSNPTQKFSYRDVTEHNRKVGWREWGIYRNNVYDNTKFKEIFNPLLKAAQEKEAAQKLARKKDREELESQENTANGFGDSDDDESFDDDSSEYSGDSGNFAYVRTLEDISRWNSSGTRHILVNNMDKNTLESRLRSCCIGSLYQEHDAGYWEDLKKDVKMLLDDLIRADSRDDLSVYMGEYMHLLQRWVLKYRNLIPPKKTIAPQGDPNHSSFPLPEEIMENPDCLRQWVETWNTFDFEIPEEGVWPVIEDEVIDLGDPHEIFAATLKSHVNLTPLDMAIEGEAGWSVIQEGLFADDVMTKAQEIIEKQREGRTDLFDIKRMKRRREKLLTYFERKYEMDHSKVAHFSNWADEMEKGERKFLKLCEES